MTTFLCKLAAGLLLVSISHVAMAQKIVKGTWSFTFSPSENLYKLIYSYENSSHGAVYIRCVPRSGKAYLIHEVKPRDIRTYEPLVSVDATKISQPFVVEWSDYDERYFFEMNFDEASPALKAMSVATVLRVDEFAYPIMAGDDRVMIAEFTKVCGL